MLSRVARLFWEMSRTLADRIHTADTGTALSLADGIPLAGSARLADGTPLKTAVP